MTTVEELRNITIFRGLQPDELGVLAAVCGEWECGQGQYIFRAGDESETLYLVKQGEVEVVAESGFFKDKRIAVIAAGEVFGELAFVDSHPRAASVRCTRPSLLYSLTRQDFRQASKPAPQIQLVVYRNIAKLLAQRLRQADDQLREALPHLKNRDPRRIGPLTI